MSSPIKRRRDGRFVIRLDTNARVVLANLAAQLPDALASRDPMVRRLFPPAYTAADHTAAEQEYRELVDSALVNHHTRSLETLVATADAESRHLAGGTPGPLAGRPSGRPIPAATQPETVR